MSPVWEHIQRIRALGGDEVYHLVRWSGDHRYTWEAEDGSSRVEHEWKAISAAKKWAKDQGWLVLG